uniref:SWIM-type domain-containing protein n=1 Tax=Lactuca sativa TaxID=4236 RepID=A0A9R1VML0_LACSA|nr:hypothetical protein LSAT_V11C500290530 [Lactuca sativa]
MLHVRFLPTSEKKWARTYFPNICWNVLNINIPEFLLVLSVTQRNVPIITLIDVIVQYIQQTFVERCVMGEFHLRSRLRSPVKRRCAIDLNRHTCSCGKWRSLGITCGHAIAATCYTENTELTDMVQIYYRADVF